MAERLDSFEFTRGDTSPFWDEILDGSIWRINWRDKASTKEVFRNRVISAADRRGLRVRTQSDGADHLVIQARPKEEDD